MILSKIEWLKKNPFEDSNFNEENKEIAYTEYKLDFLKRKKETDAINAKTSAYGYKPSELWRDGW